MRIARAAWIALACVALPLGGCLDDEAPVTAADASDAAEAGPPPGEATEAFQPRPPAGGNDPSASAPPPEHGEPKREDGPAEANLEPSRLGWHASRTVTISNDFGGAAWAAVALDNSAGSVTVEPWGGSGYHVTVVLHATGGTQEEALDHLDTLHVVHEDRLEPEPERLILATGVERDDLSSPVGQVGLGVNRWADVLLQVPPSPGYDVAIDVSSADVSVRDLSGGSLVLDTSSGDASLTNMIASSFVFDTSSGDVVFSGRADRIAGDTSSGDVQITAIVNDLAMDTSSGDLTISAEPAASGTYVVDSSSGDVEIRVPDGPRHGYWAMARTSSGDIYVQLESAEPVGDQDEERVHVVTPDLDTRAVATRIVVATSSGDIGIANQD